MTEIMMPASGIRAHVRDVDAAADLLDEIVWPTVLSGAMPDSAVRRVIVMGRLQAECRRLTADLRSWTATVRVAVTACEQSDLHTASTLS